MYLHRDERLPGQVQEFYSKNREEYFMLVPEVVRRSVVFLGAKHPAVTEPKIGGTAFFVGLLNPGVEFGSHYLVTAKHNLERIEQLTKVGLSDGKAYLRFNRRDGGVSFRTLEPSDWFYHPTEKEKVDVAVWPIPESDVLKPQWDASYFLLNKEEVADAEVIQARQIGIGDEVFIAGLFLYRPGESRNLPVVRVGTIAAMPEEPIENDWCRPHRMEAYLIEVRSIGGMSGSPVFVNIGPTHATNRREGRFFMLGLIHGHWNFPVPDTDYLVDADASRDKMNAGIAIVVPISKVLEVIHQPKLAEMRKQFIDQQRKRISELAVPD